MIQLANKYFAEKKVEEAFELLILYYPKTKNKQKIKEALINYFETLGNDNVNTVKYRKKLSSIMFA